MCKFDQVDYLLLRNR